MTEPPCTLMPDAPSLVSTKSSDQSTLPRQTDVDLEDGPLFRATIKEYEGKTSAMKGHLKRILKAASATLEAKNNLLEQDKLFIEALREAPFTEPLFSHYLDATWDKLHEQQERLSFCMQNLLISPLQKLYDMDIKTVDTKRRQFEDVSKEYYSNLSKYLSIKTPNANINIPPMTKEKKQQKAESEFMVKKSEFDLVRFDYYSFLRDLHGGKKEQEILYHLLNHHEKQYAYYQSVVKTLEPHKQGLDQLATMIAEASREQKMVNQERDEKRKLLMSKYTAPNADDTSTTTTTTNAEKRKSMYGMLSPTFLTPISPKSYEDKSPTSPPALDLDPIGLGISNVDNSKFKGIRDLEQQDQNFISSSGRKKEGFLFATSKPSKNTGGNTPAFDMSSTINWHKYWCVLSGGYLHEYSNWKKHLETHIEPINLRFATVREARNADRRFCFEVITPNFRRMYQATSNEELSSWIATINNAISSLLNGMSSAVDLKNEQSLKKSSTWKQARSLSGALSGLAAAKDKYLKKRHSGGHHRSHSHHSSGTQKLTISAPIPQGQPLTNRALNPDLLNQLKKDLSNTICADCSAKNPDWCSLNLGILICIECSGIHRSLGTHISKVRSLTLDSASFTPDIVQLLLAIGNAKSNAVWESALHQTTIKKPVPTDSRDTKLKYIHAKYIDRSLVKPLETIQPMDLLYAAIEQDDIPQALYAIALGADVNQPLPIDTAIPLIQKKKSSTLRLPLLDIDGNEYLDRTLEVEHYPSKEEEQFIVRYALHYALLPHNATEDCESNTTTSSGLLQQQQQQTGDDTSSNHMTSSSNSTHSSESGQCKTRMFPMAEFLFQNGADVSIVDSNTGCLLADLIGMGQLVDDEAISYLNIKNSLRGQSPIVRSQTIPTPTSNPTDYCIS